MTIHTPRIRSSGIFQALIMATGLTGIVLCAQGTAYATTRVQEQVPIPGLSIEESVRLETAGETLTELTTQREKKNSVRTDEMDKLVKQVNDAGHQNDPLKYQTALDRYFTYLFKVNNDDHAALSRIVSTVAETRVLVARARLGIEHMQTQIDESRQEDEFARMLKEQEENFKNIFTKPMQRTTTNVANLLMIDALSEKERERLDREMKGQLMSADLFEHWEQPLQEIPYLPAQLDPAFDQEKVIAFLDEADYNLRYNYKDLEMQLFWAEVMAKIGKAYAEGKLPLIRVQAAFQRMSRFTMNLPESQGKPWFLAAFDRLKSVRTPTAKPAGPLFGRQPTSGSLYGGRQPTSHVDTSSPEDVLKKIRADRMKEQGR